MIEMKLISASQLAKNLSITKHTLDELLLSAGFIQRDNENFILTKIGEDHGGQWQTSSRFGTYIVWPENIEISAKTTSSDTKLLNSTAIASRVELSARKINMLFSELGWIERDAQGWKLTSLGVEIGGVQKENTKNKIPFVEWPETIISNSVLMSVIKGMKNEDRGSLEEKTDSKSNNFRTKFEAKHHTTDGHFVRSKAEMIIDNWLYESEILHAYEKRLPIEEDVFCDFYIPTAKVYIEFWGIENDPKYSERKRVKQAIYKKYKFKLIELTEEDISIIDDVLPKMLLKFGLQTY